MRQDKRNIFVTRELSAQQIEYARILGLEPVVESALEFSYPDYWDRVLGTITKHSRADWVFTSANGVNALEELMNAGLQVRPEVQIFAVGRKTREALQKLGLDAKIPFTEDGKHLAELIIDEGKINEILYFHGNLRRDEMPQILRDEGIEVIEREVYKTHIHPVEIPRKSISGILFYSPSAVEGFRQGTGFKEELPSLFAIGPTTAKALKEYTKKKVVIASRPDTKTMLRMVSNHIFDGGKKV